jgi:hypothetical protein
MADKTKFEQMLATDQKVYANIVKMKALIAERRKPATDFNNGSREVFKTTAEAKAYADELNTLIQNFNDILKDYKARQADYRTNSLYKLGNKINEVNDKVTSYFKSLWNDLTGLGALPALAPLILPVSIAAGATVTAVAIAYFVGKYYESTLVDYNDSLETIKELAKTDPALADKALDKLNEIEKEQQKRVAESGLFADAGKGIKYGIIALSSVAALALGMKLYNEK